MRVRERPAEAARIWVFDALLLIALPVFLVLVSGAWPGPGNTVTFDHLSLLQRIPATGAFLALLGLWFCSEGAWARFLATDEPVGTLPYRLGKDELRIFGVTAFWAVIGGVILFCLMMPIAFLGMAAREGGAAGQALAALVAVLLLGWAIFFLPRVNASAMLAVRRKAFSPLGHFSATDPFWFRLGLAFGVGVGLSVLFGYGAPIFLAGLAGMEGSMRMMLGGQSMMPWMDWFGAQKPPHAGHAAIVLAAWAGSGAALLVSRGIYAHAAIHALEQHELDARRGYPAASRAGEEARGA